MTDITTKRWKIQCFTQRVLNINADVVIPLHQVTILTEDGETVITVKMEHLERMEPAVRSQLELMLGQYFVNLHNQSLEKPSKNSNLTTVKESTTTVPVVSPPKKKGGWPKGKPRKPKSVANGQEVKAKNSSQSGGSPDTASASADQGSGDQERVQAQPFPPSGEGWFRP